MDDLMGKIREVLADGESMKQLNELAESLFSSPESGKEESISQEKQNDTAGSGMDIDIGGLLKIGQMMNSLSEDKNAELLLALRPLLKEERRAKVDKAVKLLKLLAVWNVLKDSGMLEELF